MYMCTSIHLHFIYDLSESNGLLACQIKIICLLYLQKQRFNVISFVIFKGEERGLSRELNTNWSIYLSLEHWKCLENGVMVFATHKSTRESIRLISFSFSSTYIGKPTDTNTHSTFSSSLTKGRNNLIC